MRQLLFAALAFGLGVGLLGAAAPVSVHKLADAEQADDEDDGVQDVLYVGLPHPILIRLKLRVEGKSAFTHYDACMEKYFAFLDRNNSKTLDKNEAAKAPSAQQMLQFFAGNAFLNPGRGGIVAAVPFTDLDADRDGKVTLEEFKAYYAKNGAGPLTMVAANAAAFNPYGNGQADALTDVVFDLLDTDKDGKLSKKEIEDAEKTLLKYDADDNEMVSMAELGLAGQNVRRRVVLAKQGMRPPAQPAQATNILLIPRDSGKRRVGKNATARELIAKYAKNKGSSLSREEIGFPQKLFDSIDGNKDGKLNVLELSKWLSGRPAGDFTIRMADLSGSRRRGNRMAPAGRRGEMSVRLGGVRINVVPQAGFGSRLVEQSALLVFDQIDTGKKGFIVRKQVEGNDQQSVFLRGLFDAGDRNNDGKFTRDELKALVGTLNAMCGAQLNLSIVSTGSGLFQTLDADGDGQLSLREMRNAWKRLEPLDVNEDGFITRDEFPHQFQLTVSQGSGNAGGFVAVQPGMGGEQPARPRVRGPVWFTKMDRNADGDVSRSEWLGSKEDFDAIDTDKDGLISLEEAEAYDAKMRKKAEADE